jgi:catechol 2,3-dioxygenase-like lactoylglutathione lyase family enzyme
VKDIERSIEFYRDRLGFSIEGEASNDGKTFWCRLTRGSASLMLQQADPDEAQERRGRGVALYFICDDADVLHEEFSGRGLHLRPPTVVAYGMKQVYVPEPDGYFICFESEVEHSHDQLLATAQHT